MNTSNNSILFSPERFARRFHFDTNASGLKSWEYEVELADRVARFCLTKAQTVQAVTKRDIFFSCFSLNIVVGKTLATEHTHF